MLQVKSFKFSDDSGINELLKNYRIAQGASIFVSNGEICIPYEDGELPTNAQRIISIKEQKNTMLAQKELIEHSQDVLAFLIRDAQERVTEAEAKVSTLKAGSEKDDAKNAARNARTALKQLEDQKTQNDHEIMRININVEMFDERIAELSA